MTVFFAQGIDIVEVSRIKEIIDKYKFRFLKKIFSDEEIKLFNKQNIKTEKTILRIAGRFAAKEAASKAIGTGFRNGIRFSDFEIFNNKEGEPFMNIKGKAKLVLKNNLKIKPFVSISNEKLFTVALVTFISF